MNVAKFVLNEKTTIYLREPVIEDTELAAQVAGKKAGSENQAHLSLLLQKELLKRLLVQVNEKKLSMNDKEQLDKLLSFKEYGLAIKAMGMVVGDVGGNELTPEFVTIGGQ